jgi:hypothetical protein
MLSKKIASAVLPSFPIDVLYWNIVSFTIQGVRPKPSILFRRGITIPHIILRCNGEEWHLKNVSIKRFERKHGRLAATTFWFEEGHEEE